MSSYTFHLSRCQKEELEKEEENCEPPPSPEVQKPPSIEAGAQEQLDTWVESKKAITKNLANFIVKTQEKNKLAEKATFDILN